MLNAPIYTVAASVTALQLAMFHSRITTLAQLSPLDSTYAPLFGTRKDNGVGNLLVNAPNQPP